MRTLRLTAILLPAALLLHEGAYALGGGGLMGGAHGYLEALVPLAAAIAAALSLAAVLLPIVTGRGAAAEAAAPFVLAGALTTIFCVQELAEALLLGGGWSGFAASLAVAWLVPPLALLLGAIAAGSLRTLARAGDRLAELVQGRRAAPPVAPPAWRPHASPNLLAAACAGLSFGASRRPPPVRA